MPARGTWLHEIKHDGYRAQGHLNGARSLIYTRNGYDWTQRFARIAASLKQLPARQIILDGEIVVTDTRGIADFHLLQEDLARGQTDRLAYLVFDLLYLDGFDLPPAPLVERRKLLSQLLAQTAADSSPIQLNPCIEADAKAVFEQACALHLEGIVSKDTQSVYRSGRQDSWIKIKCAKTDTFPIIAFVEKLGASPRRIASLYLGRWEGNQLLYAGKAQTGFKQRMLYELRERLDPYIRKTSPLTIPIKKPKATWVEPAVLAEIEYSAFTAEQRLRAPIFKGIRDDLMAPRREPKRTEQRKQRAAGVSPSNILQLLPNAVVPTQDQLSRYWRAVAADALPYIARRPLKLVHHERGTTYYQKGRLPLVSKGVHQLQIRRTDRARRTFVYRLPAQWPRHDCSRHLFTPSAPRISYRGSHFLASVGTRHPTGCVYNGATLVESAPSKGSSVRQTNGECCKYPSHLGLKGAPGTTPESVELTSRCRYLMWRRSIATWGWRGEYCVFAKDYLVRADGIEPPTFAL